MCGIFAILCSCDSRKEQYQKVLNAGQLLRHRGPDWSGCSIDDNYAIGHERLSIIDVFNGSQPIEHHDIVLAVNGEIYNYKTLIDDYREQYTFDPKTQSDCEIILHLYEQAKITVRDHPQWQRENDNDVNRNDYVNDQLEIEQVLNALSGDFAFVLADKKRNHHLVARDIIGVVPLYYAYNSSWEKGSHREIAFASEMKALSNYDVIKVFPPGYYYDGEIDVDTGEPYLKPYFKQPWKTGDIKYNIDYNALSDDEFENHVNIVSTKIQDLLIDAVGKRLMTDVPFGVFLSGGLDSSVVAAIASRLCREEYGDKYRMKTFSIGLKDGNSSDKIAAEEVAEWIGSQHYHFEFTIEEALYHLKQLIYMLESYDVTTIRASMPMYLLSRRVKAMGIKMVLSGEGSDEIFGGYLYFHEAPTLDAFKQETIRRVNNLHLSDCLRANKSTMAWGLEARVPFLDKEFLNYAMNLHPRFLKTYTYTGYSADDVKLADDTTLADNTTLADDAKSTDDTTLVDNTQPTDDTTLAVGQRAMEKWIVRTSFDQRFSNISYLPSNILWRQKEQFSDGVGYGWIDSLRNIAETNILNSQMKIADTLYPINAPQTKEAFMYREYFESLFPTDAMANTVMTWVPEWSKNKDPSGRAQMVHSKTTEKIASSLIAIRLIPEREEIADILPGLEYAK